MYFHICLFICYYAITLKIMLKSAEDYRLANHDDDILFWQIWNCRLNIAFYSFAIVILCIVVNVLNHINRNHLISERNFAILRFSFRGVVILYVAIICWLLYGWTIWWQTALYIDDLNWREIAFLAQIPLASFMILASFDKAKKTFVRFNALLHLF